MASEGKNPEKPQGGESPEQTKKNGPKEKGINKPTPFTGDRKKVETFVQECRMYLQINRDIYTDDDDKIAFILSFMNDKEALRWKQTFLRAITDAEGDMTFPSTKEFIKELMNYFQPSNTTQDAAHQLAMLKQGKKSAEEIITEFRLLCSLAGWSTTTPTDNAHLIEKLQGVLNPSLVRKIMLSDNPPTDINGWVQKAILTDTLYRNTQEVMSRIEGKSRNEGRTNDRNQRQPAWSKYFGPRKANKERDPDAMDVDAMSTEKRAALMRKGACFICEEPGHMARDHDDHKKKKEQRRTIIRKTTTKSFAGPSKPKNVKEIHALLQALSPAETKELLALQSVEKEEEKEEEEKNDEDEDF
jgi:Ty3 transposon capsid-like protein